MFNEFKSKPLWLLSFEAVSAMTYFKLSCNYKKLHKAGPMADLKSKVDKQ